MRAQYRSRYAHAQYLEIPRQLGYHGALCKLERIVTEGTIDIEPGSHNRLRAFSCGLLATTIAGGADGVSMTFAQDINGDGRFDVTDVRLWIVHAFFVPGDEAVWLLSSHAPKLASFLGLGTANDGSLFSGVVSAVFWIAGLVLVRTVYCFLRDLDRALTQWVTNGYRAFLRRVRVVRTWLFCQLRRAAQAFTPRSRKSSAVIGLDEIELDELELDALRSHALLAPGYVLNVSDLASSLDIRRSEAQHVLARLERLTLLQRGFGASDGETGYRLSDSGRFFVMARSQDESGPGPRRTRSSGGP